MNLYTIGYAQKTAEEFFALIRSHHIEMLVDIRLNHRSQQAGYARGIDLCYFLREICGCEYRHCRRYAPTQSMLDACKQASVTRAEYEQRYIALLTERGDYRSFAQEFAKYHVVCLMCDEWERGHSLCYLAAELIAESDPQVIVAHL